MNGIGKRYERNLMRDGLTFLDQTRLVEEVPGVPENEKWFLWRNHNVEAHFATKALGIEYCQTNGIEIDAIEHHEP